MAGLLPTKSLLLAPFSGADETKWREWSEDILDSLDAVRPGLKAVLKDAAAVKEEGGLDEFWLANASTAHGLREGARCREEIYAALKGLTSGEAKNVV